MAKKSYLISCYNRAIKWIKDNSIPEQGIVVSTKQKIPYLKVTGYLIPTLIILGEYRLAEQYTEFLSYMQRPNGGFAGPDGKIYPFDTGQALRGLLVAIYYWARFKPFAIKAADYICSLIEEDGRILSPYNSKIPESVHVFILPVLSKAAEILNNPYYGEQAKKSLNYYKKISNCLDSNHLTHFLAYAIDGFIEMGETNYVRPFVIELFKHQDNSGSIPAYSKVKWVCSVGLAQLTIICYKLGLIKEADKSIDYLCKIQNTSGGFFGSYGHDAKYFPKEEISWAVKFFIDAINLKIEHFFENSADIFPKQISKNDGRLRAILAHMGDLRNKKVLDAGCGKGRFSLKIKSRFPSCELYGIDISTKLLQEVPASIIKKEGNILNIPFENEYFDGLFCVEVLEHAIRTEKAIEELCRVVKDNGRIIIIDKNIEKLGKMNITDFEQWFDKNGIKNILGKYCREVQVEEISYNLHNADGLFLSWTGIKGAAALNQKEWHKVMIGENSILKLVNKIKNNDFWVWSKFLLQYSSVGDSLLELGSGSGELSAILGIYGRIPYLLDYSEENLNFAKAVFKELGIAGHFYLENLLEGISLNSDSIDWVWSSGLLEHFRDEQILKILKDSIRICRKGVMAFVPNANSLLYRIGKYKMEQEGIWQYGKENPKYSMKNLFIKAGLKKVVEISIGTYHSINFLETIREDTKKFYDSLSLEEIQQLNQGYLLFIYGEK